jgi:hypothetical protein
MIKRINFLKKGKKKPKPLGDILLSQKVVSEEYYFMKNLNKYIKNNEGQSLNNYLKNKINNYKSQGKLPILIITSSAFKLYTKDTLYYKFKDYAKKNKNKKLNLDIISKLIDESINRNISYYRKHN